MKNYSIVTVGLLAILMFSVSLSCVSAQAMHSTNGYFSVSDSAKAKTDRLIQKYVENDTPGASVLVMLQGKVLYQNGYGLANLTHQIPFTASTPTNIGSTSKHFTAFAVLLLQEQGLLNIDDDIRKYMPELPDFGKTVTIRHLLSHTSGYREFLNTLIITGTHPSKVYTDEQILRLVQRQSTLQNDPGSEFNYNNTGFYIARLLVERLTDTPFDLWTRVNMFEPLGMMDTRYRATPSTVIPGRSAGYAQKEGGEFDEVQDLAGGMGPGGIYTTMDDFAKWVKNFKEHRLGSNETHELLTTSNILTTGTPSGYGLGLFIDTFRGQRYFHHGGADMAHRSSFMYFPDIDAAIVTQSNLNTFPGNLATQIAEYFLDDFFDSVADDSLISTSEKAPEDEIEFMYDVNKFDSLVGKYELVIAPGFILTFSRDGDKLWTQATGQSQIGIKATSDSTFSLIGVAANLTFHLNDDGSADKLTLHQNGNHLALKIEFKLTPDEKLEYAGSYFSSEIETMYHVVLSGDNMQLEHYHISEPIALNPSRKDYFTGSFPISSIEFMRNDAGKILGFKASNGRSRDIFFQKVEWETRN